ncbi:P-loop NTPase fold protein [Polaribacter sp.]|uniref:P-loop NTPase fold protein n=1 Tax=Polaribacter sp. TaxID=1920175 RepID=UPI003F6B82D3
MSKLLANLPIEDLTPENDYIGIIEKGTLLKSFFLNNKHEFSKIKIFSIYGEWGSGKSILMKYLEKELKGSFNTFFF